MNDASPPRRLALPRRVPVRAGLPLLRTAAKLLLASLLVGVALAVFGIDPIEMWRGLWRAATEGVAGAFSFATSNLGAVLALTATGAIVVVPLWLLRRLFAARR